MLTRLFFAFLMTTACLAGAAEVALAIDPTGPAVPKNDPGSAQLVEKPATYDGRSVRFAGEAIGEVMVRGENAWIHLNDDAYQERNIEEGAELGGYNSGMAVYVPADLVKRIDTYGDYKHEGSIVQVSGTFNAACREHGGDMDIHATRLDVLVPGHFVLDRVLPWKVWLALLLSAVAGALLVVERSSRNRVTPHRGV